MKNWIIIKEIYIITEKKIIDLVHNKWIHFGLLVRELLLGDACYINLLVNRKNIYK